MTCDHDGQVQCDKGAASSETIRCGCWAGALKAAAENLTSYSGLALVYDAEFHVY